MVDDQPIYVDVHFIREAAQMFAFHDIPLAWHLRIGVEFPPIVSPSELIGQPFKGSSKGFYHKTMSVGSPDEVRNNDLMTIDQATGLRIVASAVHLPFLQGQHLLLSDQTKAVLLDAIRQRKERDRSVTLLKKPSTAKDETKDAVGPTSGDKAADAVFDATDQEREASDL